MNTIPTKFKSQDGTIVAKISWNEDWEEFQVNTWVDKVFQKDATYHTDDLDDAVGTAKYIVSSGIVINN